MSIVLESNLVDIKDGKVKSYHYSDKKITDDVLKTSGVLTKSYSRNEYRAWGRGRIFFYLTNDGFKYDAGVNTAYLYISYYDISKVYDLVENENKYNISNFEKLYNETASDGYTAWAYFLDNMKDNPILISFVDTKIEERYERSQGGIYVRFDLENHDYIVGTIVLDGKKFYVYQPYDMLVRINNLYISDYDNPNDARDRFKIKLHEYLFKNVNFIDKYKSQYEK